MSVMQNEAVMLGKILVLSLLFRPMDNMASSPKRIQAKFVTIPAPVLLL